MVPAANSKPKKRSINLMAAGPPRSTQQCSPAVSTPTGVPEQRQMTASVDPIA
jgi:hypothetical protein